MYKNNNKLNNKFNVLSFCYFFYRNSDGKNIILFNNTEYILSNITKKNLLRNLVQNSTLVVIDHLLFQEGKEVYLSLKFERIIFLPYLMKEYYILLESLQKKHLLLVIKKNDGNVVVIASNNNHYLLHHNIPIDNLEQEDILLLPLEILYKTKGVIYNWHLYVIQILRIRQRSIMVCDLLLGLLLIGFKTISYLSK